MKCGIAIVLIIRGSWNMPTAFLLRRLDTQEFDIENLIFLFKVKVQTFLVLNHSKRWG